QHQALSAIMRFLALPMETLRCDVTERPAYRKPVGVQAAEDNAITLATALRRDDIVVLWVDEDDPPLLQLRIEEAKGRPNRAFFLFTGRIADPQILYCVTIHDPAEMQLALLVADGAVGLWKAEIGLPTADEAIKCLRFFPERRIGTL